MVRGAFSILIAATAIVGGSANARIGCRSALLADSPEARTLAVNNAHGDLKVRAHRTPIRLRVGTWNLNMLQRRIAVGPVPVGKWGSPRYSQRSGDLNGVMDQKLGSPDAPHVLFLQELWTVEDQETVAAAAARWGYSVADRDVDRRLAHGMQVLVRGATVEESGFEGLGASRRTLFEAIGRVDRGLLWVRLRLNDGQTVLAGSVHLTPFVRNHTTRRQQILALRQEMVRVGTGADHFLIGGDFNIATEYGVEDARGAAYYDVGRYLYSTFARVTGLRDAFRAVRPLDPGYTFTADFRGGNHLHGHDQRLDFLWIGERAQDVYQHVIDAHVDYEDRDGTGKLLSDHFMVEAIIEYFTAEGRRTSSSGP